MSDTPKRSLDEEARREALAVWLTRELAADNVSIVGAALLAGGAVQQNWRLEVAVTGGPRAGTHTWVLRTDAAARLSMSLDRVAEFRCIAAAHAAGVKVAPPIAVCDDAALIGAPFAIQGFVSGNAQGRRIVRDPALASYGDALAQSIGAEMAKLHTIVPKDGVLPFLPRPLANPSRRIVADCRAVLDKASAPRPALEYALAWLDRNAPEPKTTALVHGDLRTGNYMVESGALTAILDWEFCHWGDPREDLGWFIARCWRFGNDAKVAGGISKLAFLLEGYNSIATVKVTAPELQYFEVQAAARWATIALAQGDRFVKGGERSLELALTGLMPPEMELDCLDLIDRIEGKGTRS